MKHKDKFKRSYDELKRSEKRLVDSVLKKLRLQIEQGDDKYGSWYGALVLPLKAKCKCEPTEQLIVSVTIETRYSKFDDAEYFVGDYKLSTGREPLGAPIAYVAELPFEVERAFLDEAAQLVVDLTWDAVAALVPELAAAVKPDRAEVAAQPFGAYARRPGTDNPLRLL